VAQSTAVLVIDVQTGLFSARRPLHDGANVVERIRALTDRAHTAGVPVVYIQDNDVGPIDSPAWQLHPRLAPRPADLYVRKPYSDSFYQTELHRLLAERAISRLVAAGCKTDACVDATSRRAISLGYDVTLVADGHTTDDNEFLTGAQSIAYYNIVLEGLGLEDGFGNGLHSISLSAADAVVL
jgi:nicotinamidase-related amidase